jgi:hypothetical protein
MKAGDREIGTKHWWTDAAAVRALAALAASARTAPEAMPDLAGCSNEKAAAPSGRFHGWNAIA